MMSLLKHLMSAFESRRAYLKADENHGNIMNHELEHFAIRIEKHQRVMLLDDVMDYFIDHGRVLKHEDYGLSTMLGFSDYSGRTLSDTVNMSVYPNDQDDLFVAVTVKKYNILP